MGFLSTPLSFQVQPTATPGPAGTPTPTPSTAEIVMAAMERKHPGVPAGVEITDNIQIDGKTYFIRARSVGDGKFTLIPSSLERAGPAPTVEVGGQQRSQDELNVIKAALETGELERRIATGQATNEERVRYDQAAATLREAQMRNADLPQRLADEAAQRLATYDSTTASTRRTNQQIGQSTAEFPIDLQIKENTATRGLYETDSARSKALIDQANALAATGDPDSIALVRKLRAIDELSTGDNGLYSPEQGADMATQLLETFALQMGLGGVKPDVMLQEATKRAAERNKVAYENRQQTYIEGPGTQLKASDQLKDLRTNALTNETNRQATAGNVFTSVLSSINSAAKGLPRGRGDLAANAVVDTLKAAEEFLATAGQISGVPTTDQSELMNNFLSSLMGGANPYGPGPETGSAAQPAVPSKFPEPAQGGDLGAMTEEPQPSALSDLYPTMDPIATDNSEVPGAVRQVFWQNPSSDRLRLLYNGTQRNRVNRTTAGGVSLEPLALPPLSLPPLGTVGAFS